MRQGDMPPPVPERVANPRIREEGRPTELGKDAPCHTKAWFKSCRSVFPQLAHHARSTTNLHRATRAENYAHCVNCDTGVCSETLSDLLAQQRIHSSGLTELLLAFHPSCITSSRSSTFPDSLRSAPLNSIQLQSTNHRFISRFHQLVSKLGVTLLHLNT